MYFIFIFISLNLDSNYSSASNQSVQWLYLDTANSNLPDNTITGFTEDSQGYIWVSTYNGFARYNGNNQWMVFHNPNAMPGIDVCECIKAQDSIIWVGTVNGLVRYCNNHITVYDPNNSALGAFYVYSLEIENNILWIGSGDYGVYRFDGSTFTNYSYSNSGNMPLGNIWSIAIDHASQKWFVCSDARISNTYPGAVVKFDGSNWTLYDTSNSGLQIHPTEISIDAQDNKWITSGYEGLVEYDNASWTIFDTSTVSNQAFFEYSKVAFDSNNNKWLTAVNGFCKYDNVLWTFFDSTNVPFSNQIKYSREIFIDSKNNKWIGTYNYGALIYNENGVSLTSVNELNKEVKMEINQNIYSGSVIVSFQILKNTNIKLSIVDQTGKKISNIIDEFYMSGTYKKEIYTSGLSSGIYYFNLSTTNSNISKNILIVN